MTRRKTAAQAKRNIAAALTAAGHELAADHPALRPLHVWTLEAERRARKPRTRAHCTGCHWNGPWRAHPTNAEQDGAKHTRTAMDVEQQNDCAAGRHRYGRESLVFKGQRQCRCGAVEGENPN